MRNKLAKNIVEKYKLKDKQKIFFYELKIISRKENMDIRDLIFVLGVCKNIIYKTASSWSRINLLKEVNIRQKVKLIKLDLFYLSEYGQRNYTKQEIIQICNEYKVSFNNFVTYIGYKKFVTMKICIF